MQRNLDCVFGSVLSYVVPKWKFSAVEVYSFYPVPQLHVQTERKVALCSRFQIPSFGNWWGRGGDWMILVVFLCLLFCLHVVRIICCVWWSTIGALLAPVCSYYMTARPRPL